MHIKYALVVLNRNGAMTFPEHTYASIGDFMGDYASAVSHALASVNRTSLAKAGDILNAALSRDAHIFSCGNGGSAAISNHLVCDHAKAMTTDTGLTPRVRSLSSAVELMTAIANDISYNDVFSYQLKQFGRAGDVLMTVSSSGNSENIVQAITTAKELKMETISLTGFSGGRSANMSDVNLHVSSDNYGVIEDAHQSLMHVLAQYIRIIHMPEHLISDRKF